MLRLGLVVVLMYAAVNSLLHPLDWSGFLPHLLTAHFSAFILLKIFALYELVLVIWLIVGKLLKYCGLVCALTFAAIIGSNFSQLLITFRDIGLFFMALALFFMESGNETT